MTKIFEVSLNKLAGSLKLGEHLTWIAKGSDKADLVIHWKDITGNLVLVIFSATSKCTQAKWKSAPQMFS